MFPIPIAARAVAGLGIIACTACVGVASGPQSTRVPQSFYTVTAEIALARHEARIAALEYAAAAQNDADLGLLRRATEVTAQCLQPSLTLSVATRWIDADPQAMDAHRAAGSAALQLYRIEQAAAQYRVVLATSARGTEAEFADLEARLATAENAYGARQLADRLAEYFPRSAGALRMKAFAALRGDDPAAAAGTFTMVLAAADVPPASRQELTQGLWRARILAGDVNEPLVQARALLAAEDTVENHLDYALALLAAHQNSAARAQLLPLARDPQAGPQAVRLLGLLDFQEGNLDDAGTRFAELVTTGKFLDDALYYLALIAERHEDYERALRLYAEVRTGENAVPALLRAAAILRSHGAAPAAEELLDELVAEEPQRAPEIWSARAHIYADAGDRNQAAALLDQAAQQFPDSVELRYAMASIAEEQGKVADALNVLKEIADRRPTDPAALNAYGYTLANNNRRLKMARRLIERAFAAAPKSAAIMDSMGWVMFRQGQGEQALPFLHAAYEDDRDGDIAAHLGEVLWQLGRRTEAEAVWSDASRAGADNPLLRATRSRLRAAN